MKKAAAKKAPAAKPKPAAKKAPAPAAKKTPAPKKAPAPAAKKAPADSPKKKAASSAVTPAMKKAAAAAIAKATAAGLSSPSRAKVGTIATHATVPTTASVFPADADRRYWLIKSEPFKWSWDQMLAVDKEHWDGVRNYQAANNMKAMKLGDLAFFYHSNEGKEIVGIVQCVGLYYPDPSDDTGRGFGMVDFAAVRPVPVPVGLHALKAKAELQQMDFVRQGRLSVCAVTPSEWDVVCGMAGITKEKK